MRVNTVASVWCSALHDKEQHPTQALVSRRVLTPMHISLDRREEDIQRRSDVNMLNGSKS